MLVIQFSLPYLNMTTNRTPRAKKQYCVWADYNRRVYQHVEASSPQGAYKRAKRREYSWEPCTIHDKNAYRLSNEVQDLETEEFIPIKRPKHCKSCSSELVESVNESIFRSGECDGCERDRYESQPKLLKAVTAMRNRTESLDYEDGDDYGRMKAMESALDDIRDTGYAAICAAHRTSC
jgi:hypothetical protein